MEAIFRKYIATLDRAVDFEISIDETATPTSPEAHYLVANELRDRGVTIFSMAPRFCGEFQKGIDYIGDIAQFERELASHAAIAVHFEYKLSIHSGSDKFSVFPLIGQYTNGLFHIKTAGTNWLEAVRVVAKVNPSLYRRMHQYALDHFSEATAYYHVTTDINAIVPLGEVSDAVCRITWKKTMRANCCTSRTACFCKRRMPMAANNLRTNSSRRWLSKKTPLLKVFAIILADI